MRCVTHPTHDSVFGDTYHGVPNPNVPHRHPYPTRYHGPIYTMPMYTGPFVERPYGLAPFMGTDGLGACPCGCGGKCGCAGVGQFGQDEQPCLLRSVTGSSTLDAVVGGALGYALSPRPEQRVTWTGVGALATMLLGTLGIVGTAGAIVYSMKK